MVARRMHHSPPTPDDIVVNDSFTLTNAELAVRPEFVSILLEGGQSSQTNSQNTNPHPIVTRWESIYGAHTVSDFAAPHEIRFLLDVIGGCSTCGCIHTHSGARFGCSHKIGTCALENTKLTREDAINKFALCEADLQLLTPAKERTYSHSSLLKLAVFLHGSLGGLARALVVRATHELMEISRKKESETDACGTDPSKYLPSWMTNSQDRRETMVRLALIVLGISNNIRPARVEKFVKFGSESLESALASFRYAHARNTRK